MVVLWNAFGVQQGAACVAVRTGPTPASEPRVNMITCWREPIAACFYEDAGHHVEKPLSQ